MTTLKGEQGPAKYLELNRRLREQIETGRFRSGDQIPTEQELALTYEVSRNTVRQAISMLEDDAYLIRRRGAGTFVAKLATDGKPVPSLKEIAFLLVDLPEGEGYSLWKSRAAQRWLAERDIHLSIYHLMTQDLVRGRRPGLLRPDKCQALLMDGWVSPVHCALAEELELPYLVVGNRPVDPGTPHARYAMDRIIRRAVAHLHALRPDQPIALMVEPFRFHLTHEIYEAYSRAVEWLPQRGPILQTPEDRVAGEALDRLFDTIDGPFSLLTTDMEWEMAAETFRRRGASPSENPVLVIGHERLVRPQDRPLCHWMPFNGEHLIEAALPQFLDAYRDGRTEHLRIDVDVEVIEPPTRPQ